MGPGQQQRKTLELDMRAAVGQLLAMVLDPPCTPGSPEELYDPQMPAATPKVLTQLVWGGALGSSCPGN